MPFLMKTTFTFAGLEQGWSETFYWTAATDDLNAAEALVTPLAQKRAKLLSQSYMLIVVRNAIVLSDTNVKLKRVTDLFEPRLPGVAAWADAEPNIALMCVWQTGNNRQSKKQYMRGVPAGIVDMGKKPDLAFGAFLSNFNSWRQAMITFQAGWLVTAPVMGQTAIITNYMENAATGIVTFTLAAPLTWPVDPGFPTRVYISLPRKSPLDGPVIVIPDVTGSAPFTKNPYGVAPFVMGQIGTMQLRAPSLVTLAPIGGQGAAGVIHPQRMVTHKTGRPSYASRGRASARTHW